MKDYFDDCDDAYEEMRDEGWRLGTPHTREIELPKYKKSLRLEREYIQGRYIHNVYSYNNLVAEITNGELLQVGWWSKLTQRHINHIVKHFKISTIIKQR